MAVSFGIVSPELWALREDLGCVLGASPVRVTRRPRGDLREIVGPHGPGGHAARRTADRLGLPYRPVAIGPLACIRPGLPERPLSLRVAAPGDEAAGSTDSSVRDHLALWRRLRLSRRNDGRDRLPDGLGDASFAIAVASRDEAGTRRAIEEARVAYPALRVAVTAEAGEPPEIARLPGRRDGDVVAVAATNPHALFDRAQAVFAAAGSPLGRDALLAGVPAPDGQRLGEPGRAALFRRAFLDGVAYLDPWRRTPIGFAEAAETLAWLRDRFHENGRRTVCVGISRWKRPQVSAFLEGPDGPPLFEPSSGRAAARAARTGAGVAAWETRMPAALPAACAAAGVPLVRMEDGFLRSVGLGAAFRPGASAVLDARGIYYDPGRPSDLETILAETAFGPALAARAAALRASIVALRLSKYNVGAPGEVGDLAGAPPGRPVVLVPGQVEDDASVRLGSPVVRTNLALLEAARRANPDAFLIFKPHPDVAAGLRRGRVGEAEARRHADRVVTDLSIADLLDHVDAVETMTSLTGFEALLRGCRVAAHGQPFYAGWGLTTDRHPPARRGRPLTLDELVAGALILYPRYLDPVSGLRCTPELLVERLAAAREAADSAPASAARARALYVRARHALLGPLARAIRAARGAGPRGSGTPGA